MSIYTEKQIINSEMQAALEMAAASGHSVQQVVDSMQSCQINLSESQLRKATQHMVRASQSATNSISELGIIMARSHLAGSRLREDLQSKDPVVETCSPPQGHTLFEYIEID